MIRIGIVGAGWMARRLLADIAEHDEIAPVGVWSRTAGSREDIAREFGLAAMPTLNDLLAADLDVVYICTTPSSHRELGLAALRAGIPVLLEKPFTSSAREAEELIDEAHARNIFLMEAMWMRFNPVILEMLRRAQEGVFGDLRTLMASAGFAAPPDHRLWDAGSGGGTLLDGAVYPLTLSQMFLGPVVGISASGSTTDYRGRPAGVDSELAVRTEHGDGRRAMFFTSARGSLPCDAYLGGSAGEVRFDTFFWNPPAVTFREGRQPPQRIESTQTGGGYSPMLDALVEALVHGWAEHPLCTHEQTLAAMRSLDAIRLDARI